MNISYFWKVYLRSSPNYPQSRLTEVEQQCHVKLTAAQAEAAQVRKVKEQEAASAAKRIEGKKREFGGGWGRWDVTSFLYFLWRFESLSVVLGFHLMTKGRSNSLV